MKENGAARILFKTKKRLKSRQTFHRSFLKPQFKVYRGASIFHFNASFSDVPYFLKISQAPGYNQQMLNSVVYNLCPSRLALRLTLIFIRHMTWINSNFFKQKKISLLFWIKFKQFHTFSVCSKLQFVFSLYMHFSLL